MNSSTSQLLLLLRRIEAALNSPDAATQLMLVGETFDELASVSESAGKSKLFDAAKLISRLFDAIASWTERYPDDTSIVREIIDYTKGNLGTLEQAIGSDEEDFALELIVETINASWSDHFAVDDSFLPPGGSSWESDSAEFSNEDANGDADDSTGKDAIAMLLSAVSQTGESLSQEVPNESIKPSPAQPTTNEQKVTAAAEVIAQVSSSDQIFSTHTPSVDALQVEAVDLAEADREARNELQSDQEMLEAYLDDSLRCVALMEAAALQLDESPGSKESIRAFCRELHTLKGASATVGLAALAAHLHQLETNLESIFADSREAKTEPLFEAVDFVRSEMDRLGKKSNTATEPVEPDPQPTDFNICMPTVNAVQPVSSSSVTDATAAGSHGDASIRIRAAHLDRLMDMLAELVVLRNRRENNASEYDLLYSELSRCSTRLSLAEEQSGRMPNSTVVQEVSKDIEAVARGFRSLQKPVANDNAAISRFIRDFRQEIMQLRRVPVSGLFSRLQRAARDASKTESKLVRIQVHGEHTGLEQEIQERLYDPLLHMVRNCVSHGIQRPEDRVKSGKDETGTITLAASASAQLLVIEVRDDGNGVDYEAIRKRGIEKGLLSSSQQTSKDDLANLIFHPGFSTKQEASEISGRGVGMDVVATTLEQLRGRIEVDSETGKGTTIRLLIPLRTGIEHVMVFRSGNQLYALPMQSIVAAKKSRAGFTNLSRFTFSGRDSENSAGEHVLVLKRSGLAADSPESQIALAVDELLGPEEVVVRGLPTMIRMHPLFSGITLSGSGEKVMLLASETVADYCQPESEQEQATIVPEETVGLRALVVDDSLTARKFVAKLLNENGFATVEAGDGIDAIEILHRSSFDLVVTDLDMPRLGGLELLADVQSGQYCDAPFVVVSSRDDENFRRQAMEYGACAYMTKPVSKQRFQQQLEQLGLFAATCQG